MDMSNTITKLAPALLRAQKNMVGAVKDAKNPFFKSKYADLNSVREASHGPLNAEGIVVLQPTVHLEGKSFVKTMLLHESGEFICSFTEIVTKDVGNPQAAGSAISYARRYGLQSLVSLGTEDDDGNAATGNKVTPVITTPTKSNGSFKTAQAPKAMAPSTSDSSGWD